jgi:hypothetical protein
MVRWESVRFKLDDELSIRKAERRKEYLENNGYSFVGEDNDWSK